MVGIAITAARAASIHKVTTEKGLTDTTKGNRGKINEDLFGKVQLASRCVMVVSFRIDSELLYTTITVISTGLDVAHRV